MPELTRRRFLGSSAALAAGTQAALLPNSLGKLLADNREAPGSLDDVEHVIILIQENRSFDHYLGTLSGVRGFSDRHAMRLPDGATVFYQPDSLNPDGYELPFHLDTTKTNAAAIHSPSHAWTTQHQSLNGGAMDNWLPAHRASDGAYGPLVMGYYERADLPFHYALADAFTVCDSYFCSVLGPTHPNRLVAMTGTIDPDGKYNGPAITNSIPAGGFTWTTYAERLQDAGIDWRSYQPTEKRSELSWFAAFRQAPTNSELYLRGVQPRPLSAFMDDVANGDIAQVTWLHADKVHREHPSSLPAAGSTYMYGVLEALASRPDIWAKTVLFITYDENGGFFDHVKPPAPPLGTPGEYLTVNPLPGTAGGIAGPVGLGFRVPMIVVSPWSRGGWVCSETFDHTSTLRFVEKRFGVREPNISDWRRRACGDLTSALRFHQPRVTFPKLPDPAPVLALEQQEVASLPEPTVPADQVPPRQEPGNRPHTRPHHGWPHLTASPHHSR